MLFFFSSRRRHTIWPRDWSSDVCSSDSIAPMAFGNIALDLILRGEFGRLVVLNNGRYGDLPIDVVTSTSKVVDVDKFYSRERLRPLYNVFEGQPLFIMASQIVA